MGFSLPLHLKQTDTNYELTAITICVVPIFSLGLYFIFSRFVFKRIIVGDWFRCSVQSGLLSYMSALQTFKFEVMHLVLLVSCINFMVMDKILLLILRFLPSDLTVVDVAINNDANFEQTNLNFLSRIH